MAIVPMRKHVIMQGGGKAAGVQDTAAEPAKEDQPKEAKAPAEKPVENGLAKVEKHEEGASGDKDKEKKKKKYKVDEELLLAFRYFDRNCAAHPFTGISKCLTSEFIIILTYTLSVF